MLKKCGKGVGIVRNLSMPLFYHGVSNSNTELEKRIMILLKVMIVMRAVLRRQGRD